MCLVGMKHRYMEENLYIGEKGHISRSEQVYEGNKCHVSYTVSENIRTLGVDHSIKYYSIL